MKGLNLQYILHLPHSAVPVLCKPLTNTHPSTIYLPGNLTGNIASSGTFEIGARVSYCHTAAFKQQLSPLTAYADTVIPRSQVLILVPSPENRKSQCNSVTRRRCLDARKRGTDLRRGRRGAIRLTQCPGAASGAQGGGGSAPCVAQGRGCSSAGPRAVRASTPPLLRPHGAGPAALPAPPAPRPGPARRSPVLRGRPPLPEQAQQRAGGGGPGDGGVPRGEELAVGGHGESSAEPPTERSRAEQPSEGCREGAAPAGPAPPAGQDGPRRAGGGLCNAGTAIAAPRLACQRADPSAQGTGGRRGAFPPSPGGRAEPLRPGLPRGPRGISPGTSSCPAGSGHLSAGAVCVGLQCES